MVFSLADPGAPLTPTPSDSFFLTHNYFLKRNRVRVVPLRGVAAKPYLRQS